MAGWEEELTAILQQLGVEQETAVRRHQLRKPLRPDKHSNEQLSEALSWDSSNVNEDEDEEEDEEEEVEDWVLKEEDTEEDIPDLDITMPDLEMEDDEYVWMRDPEMMHYEVNSIVNQVVHLMQHGDLDQALKDDVMIVLRALRRRATVTQQAAHSDEAYLEFASAMLHFCRLILQLSEVASEE
jgi:hypothetical protein